MTRCSSFYVPPFGKGGLGGLFNQACGHANHPDSHGADDLESIKYSSLETNSLLDDVCDYRRWDAREAVIPSHCDP